MDISQAQIAVTVITLLSAAIGYLLAVNFKLKCLLRVQTQAREHYQSEVGRLTLAICNGDLIWSKK